MGRRRCIVSLQEHLCREPEHPPVVFQQFLAIYIPHRRHARLWPAHLGRRCVPARLWLPAVVLLLAVAAAGAARISGRPQAAWGSIVAHLIVWCSRRFQRSSHLTRGLPAATFSYPAAVASARYVRLRAALARWFDGYLVRNLLAIRVIRD